MDCTSFSERRRQCHGVYGKTGEDCLHQELSEKRCFSLKHCKDAAADYYGKSVMMHGDDAGDKELCSSWAEAFVYGPSNDKALMLYGSQVVEHHRKAQTEVNQDPWLKKECRAVAFRLAQCLRAKKVTF